MNPPLLALQILQISTSASPPWFFFGSLNLHYISFMSFLSIFFMSSWWLSLCWLCSVLCLFLLLWLCFFDVLWFCFLDSERESWPGNVIRIQATLIVQIIHRDSPRCIDSSRFSYVTLQCSNRKWLPATERYCSGGVVGKPSSREGAVWKREKWFLNKNYR